MPTTSPPRTLVWFRRDLRDFDHAALHAALASGAQVHCVFVFDRAILDALASRADKRVEFIHGCVTELAHALATRGGQLIVLHDDARTAIPALARQLRVDEVRANRDYEPAAIARDSAVARALHADGIDFHLHKDQVIFDRDEILTGAGTPYSVFTPYRKAWLARLVPDDVAPRVTDGLPGRLAPPTAAGSVPTLSGIGFQPAGLDALGIVPGMTGGATRFDSFSSRIARYHAQRDYPAVDGTSRLSVDLRFGTVSIRSLVAFAHAQSLQRDNEGATAWLSELVWREFYAQVLWHRPDVVDASYRAEYAGLRFPDPPGHFEAWCEGRTGYPLVDAAMRQLTATGLMHNRLRMVTASFLVKHLLVDWRRGERFFATHLLDYDLASNNGGWQWAASTGCDAQPWFRIFNPVTQSERFDPEGTFIRRHVPELAHVPAAGIHAPWLLTQREQQSFSVVVGRDYPAPIVDHATARAAALALFGKT